MNATTPAPGQTAYEARYASAIARTAQHFSYSWDDVDPGNRTDWAAAETTVRDAERERIRQLAIRCRAVSVSPTGRMLPFEELLRGGTGEIPALAPELAAATPEQARRTGAERDWLAAALRRLASDEWLGTQGYDGDEFERRVDFARDKLAAVAPLPLPGEAAAVAATTGHRDPVHLMTIEMGAWCGVAGPGNGRASSAWREVTCTDCHAKRTAWFLALVWDMLQAMPASHAALAFAVRAGRLGVTDEQGRPLAMACATGDDPEPRPAPGPAAAVTPAQDPPRACDVDVWDGPYRMNCGLTLVNGKCMTHGESTMRRWRAAQETKPVPEATE